MTFSGTLFVSVFTSVGALLDPLAFALLVEDPGQDPQEGPNHY